MKYLLDTDHISILQLRSGQEYRGLALRAGRQAEDLSVSIISFHEQVLGGHTYLSRARNMGEVMKGYKLLEQIIQGFSAALVLPFDEKAAEHFENLRASRIRIATMDLRIAAIALSRELVLLTRNRRDFIQVPGLVMEDWTT